MKDSKFIIYDYTFSSRKRILLKSLNKYGITYNINDNKIYFETKFENETQKWYAEYKKNKILLLSFYCESENKFASTKIKNQLNKNYCCVNHDVLAKVDYYESSSDENVKISVGITQSFMMIVSFVPVEKYGYRKHRDKVDIKEIVFYVANAIFGLGLSVACYLFYYFFNLKWLNILMAVISVSYTIVSIYFLLIKMECTKKKAFLINTCFSVLYWLVTFVILLIVTLNSNLDLGPRIVDLIYYSFYAMPSYMVVVAIILLFLVGQ